MKVLLPTLAAILALSLGAAPAAAKPRDSGRLTDRIGDPALQHSMAAAIAALSEAMLDMPVEPFARAMRTIDPEAARDVPPDATVGDLAGPDARRMPREMARKVPQMMGAVAGMAGAMEAMLPQLEAMGDEMRERIEDADLR
jgi:type VI protein secretion system component VasK